MVRTRRARPWILAGAMAVATCATAACSTNGAEDPPPPPSTTTTTLAAADADRETGSGVVLTVDDVDGTRGFIARHEGRTVRASTTVDPQVPDGVALVIAEETSEGGLSLLVLDVTEDVRSVVLYGVSGRIVDEVAPVGGVAAVATIAGYDRIEARDADGLVLTTCWDEAVDESGATCISRVDAGS